MSFKSSVLIGAAIFGAISIATPVQYIHNTTESSQGTYQQYADAQYNLVDSYTSSNFFSSFNFFTDSDPTHGYVSYQSQANAQSAGLINTNSNQIYMGVDHTTVNPASPGRKSVRVTSNKSYGHGLFIADISHMPASVCGVWVSELFPSTKLSMENSLLEKGPV